ncbi:MAG TPA: metal-dependent hydrolase [Terriglobales bacterium]|nr:metal-dependent hydrolase [Terriglobales bacterium]
MFVGHFGLAFAGKKLAPKTSLGALVFATEFVDLIWPICLLLGIEHVVIAPGITRMTPLDFTDYPITHSLLMGLVWAIVVGGIYFLLRRNFRGAFVIAVGVISHWILDWLTHRPDLLLYPGGMSKYGLGLWNHPVAEMILEGGIFAVGAIFYLTATRARDKVGLYGTWSLIVFLLFVWLSAVFAGAPPNPKALAWGGLSLWITVLWAWWVDKHRDLVAAKP